MIERERIWLIAYVDDNTQGIGELLTFLREKLHTKNLGQLRYFLGIEVARSKEGIGLSQQKYVLDILEDTDLIGAKQVETHTDPHVKLCGSRWVVVESR